MDILLKTFLTCQKKKATSFCLCVLSSTKKKSMTVSLIFFWLRFSFVVLCTQKKNATFYTFQQMFTHFFYFLTCSIKVILDAQTFTFKRKNSFKATLLSLATHLSVSRSNIFLKLELQKKKNSLKIKTPFSLVPASKAEKIFTQ